MAPFSPDYFWLAKHLLWSEQVGSDFPQLALQNFRKRLFTLYCFRHFLDSQVQQPQQTSLLFSSTLGLQLGLHLWCTILVLLSTGWRYLAFYNKSSSGKQALARSWELAINKMWSKAHRGILAGSVQSIFSYKNQNQDNHLKSIFVIVLYVL